MCAPADIFLALLAILFPPLPVWIKTGICSCPSLLNIVLLVLGYVPGLLHAWYIIAAIPDPQSTAYYYEEIPDAEAGRTRYDTQAQPRDFAPLKQSYAYYVVRVPGPNGAGNVHGGPGVGGGVAGANAASGYVAPPPQLGPRSYGATDAPAAGPSVGEQQPQGAPPSYDQAIQGDNKLQK